MYSYLRNILILLLLILSTSSVLAQVVDIKLNCQISLTTNYSNGVVEKRQTTELIEVRQIHSYLSIFANSDNVANVSTEATSKGFTVLNLSDQNKWDLAIEKTGYMSQIIIDRNTAQIFHKLSFQDPKVGSLRTQGSGNCEKVNTDKKLF